MRTGAIVDQATVQDELLLEERNGHQRAHPVGGCRIGSKPTPLQAGYGYSRISPGFLGAGMIAICIAPVPHRDHNASAYTDRDPLLGEDHDAVRCERETTSQHTLRDAMR
jgi:hypothetical protein